MKARPVKIIDGKQVECEPKDATHLEIVIPSGILEHRLLPIQIGEKK